MSNSPEISTPDGRNPTIALDFDGTLAHHAPCPPALNPNGPIEGALDFVRWLTMHGYEVVVLSSRAGTNEGRSGIIAWLKRHGFPSVLVTNEKVRFDLLVDDRAVRFEGDYAKIRTFLNMCPAPTRWELKP